MSFECLHSLVWRRLRFRIRNIRNVHAKEPPHFIMQAILKGGLARAGLAGQVDFLFHPAHNAFPARVAKGHVYEVEVVLPLATEAEAAALAGALPAQIASQRNFVLEAMEPVECRHLGLLLEERGELISSAPAEICLDFISPLDFPAMDPGRPWLLDASLLLRLCTVHLARLYPQLPWPWDIPPVSLQALPWFWERSEPVTHRSKSQPGSLQKLSGWTGPLYLRGDWMSVLPLLLVCSELHTGYGRGDEHGLLAQRTHRHRLASGNGAFRLRMHRTFFDRHIVDPGRYETIRRQLLEESAVAADLHKLLDAGKHLAREVAESVRTGSYRPQSARAFSFAKKSGGQRTISLLQPGDAILHRVFDAVLRPACDRMFEAASVGFRSGRSVDTARRMIAEAVKQGATHAVRADIETFFDSMAWDALDAALLRALPSADQLTLAALRQVVRTPVEENGRPVPRERGVLQGSPLSPLLANLFLDTFDEQMVQLGHTLIRYGDDFLILAKSLESGQQALQDANQILTPLGLSLSPEKTAITPLDLGFSFLGMRLPGALDEERVGRASLRKPLFIRRPFAFTGIDVDSVVVRKDDALLARLPLRRLSEIIFHGDGAVSQRLLQRCLREKIPVSFCSPAGWYHGTLQPDSRLWFERLTRHQRRHEELGDGGRLAVARALVEAKLRNHRHWIRALPGGRGLPVARVLEELIEELPAAASVESLRGYEGSGARAVFAFLNSRFQAPEFHAKARVPRFKPDPCNALMDFLYSMLFCRINVLLRANGLNPYLGFLHSHQDQYESLVCDLQEPFRPRVDRLAQTLVNRHEITTAHFEQDQENNTWRLTSEGAGLLIEAFEREEQVRLASEPSSLGELIAAQVHALRRWVDGQEQTLPVFVAEAFAKTKQKTQTAPNPPPKDPA